MSQSWYPLEGASLKPKLKEIWSRRRKLSGFLEASVLDLSFQVTMKICKEVICFSLPLKIQFKKQTNKQKKTNKKPLLHPKKWIKQKSYVPCSQIVNPSGRVTALLLLITKWHLKLMILVLFFKKRRNYSLDMHLDYIGPVCKAHNASWFCLSRIPLRMQSGE